MRLATRAGVLVTAGLLAYGPVHTAHAATGGPPSLSCTYTTTDTEVTLTVEASPPIDDLRVRIDGDRVEPLELANSKTIPLVSGEKEDSDDVPSLEISSGDSESWETCEPAQERSSPTPTDTTPSPTPTPPEMTPSPTSTSGPTSTPSETDSAEPDQTSSPDTDPTSPTPSESAESPTTTPTPPPSATPTTPTQPSTPPVTSQAPPPPSPPMEPETYLPESTPDATASTDRAQSNYSPETDQRAPRQFRPLAESPRYLLPHLLGTRTSQRGSPLILPQPQNTQDRASELETLPPISEDELEAIKAQLSSPGRADTAASAPQLQGVEPDERISSNTSWWLVAGLAALVGGGGLGWLFWQRRKRRH